VFPFAVSSNLVNYDAVAVAVGVQSRERVAQPAAARQLHEQKRLLIDKGHAAAGAGLAWLAERAPRRAVHRIPERDRLRVGLAPGLLVLLDRVVGGRVVDRRQFLPRAEGSHVAECEIAGLADRAGVFLG